MARRCYLLHFLHSVFHHSWTIFCINFIIISHYCWCVFDVLQRFRIPSRLFPCMSLIRSSITLKKQLCQLSRDYTSLFSLNRGNWGVVFVGSYDIRNLLYLHKRLFVIKKTFDLRSLNSNRRTKNERWLKEEKHIIGVILITRLRL